MQNKNLKAPELIVAFYISIVWVILVYFLWRPLIIPALIWLAYYGAVHLRKNLSYSRNYFRPIITGLIWGTVLASGLYFLNSFTGSPLWWRIGTYLFGLLAAGYIGYGYLIEGAGVTLLVNTKHRRYHFVSLLLSIVSYSVSLLLLHFG